MWWRRKPKGFAAIEYLIRQREAQLKKHRECNPTDMPHPLLKLAVVLALIAVSAVAFLRMWI